MAQVVVATSWLKRCQLLSLCTAIASLSMAVAGAALAERWRDGSGALQDSERLRGACALRWQELPSHPTPGEDGRALAGRLREKDLTQPGAAASARCHIHRQSMRQA